MENKNDVVKEAEKLYDLYLKLSDEQKAAVDKMFDDFENK